MSCNQNELLYIEGVRERTKFFDRSQDGGRSGAVIWQGNLVWESGSFRELSEGGSGVMFDSTWLDSSDSRQVRENLSFQKVFAEQRLEDSVKIFSAAKDALKTQAQDSELHGTQPPAKSQLQEVRLLKKEVRKWSRNLDKIFQILNPPPQEVTYTKDELNEMEVNRSDAENFLEALAGIQI